MNNIDRTITGILHPVLPYQKTLKYEEAITDKFKELISTGMLGINAAAAIFYRGEECHHSTYVERVLSLQGDEKGFYLGCHPFTNLDKIECFSSVMVLVGLAEVYSHLMFHMEKGYKIDDCPYCNKVNIDKFYSSNVKENKNITDYHDKEL